MLPSMIRVFSPLVLVLLLVLPPAVAAAGDQPPNTLTRQEWEEGWILLFDGETDFGWQAASKADWKVADGAISVRSGQPGLFYTTTQFADFELKVDFRAAAATNSGIFLRTPPVPTDPKADCYELNIAAPEVSPFFTGSFVGRAKAGEYRPSASWQTFHVTAIGGRFTVSLDGRQVLDYEDPTPIGRGHIGLQLNSGQVEFRNIKLKPLSLEPLFNGKDLSGWTVFPGKKSVFTVTPDGELSLKDGPGQIESARQFADFCVQLDVLTLGKNLNSGLFFRSIPGLHWQGYEAQIQNGYADGDRAKPVDGGTGGIYRRQPARRIVADDLEWFTMTVIAVGNHMAAWVNGIQVSDWTDTRPANENPRQGSRLAAGTFILQGHDATTDLRFRNFRAVELAPR